MIETTRDARLVKLARLSLAVFCLTWFNAVSVRADDFPLSQPVGTNQTPLQGEVEESGIAPSKAGPVAPKEPLAQPVLPTLKTETGEGAEEAGADNSDLKAKVEKSELKGEEETDDQSDDLAPGNAKVAPQGGVLKGSARLNDSELAGEDPDAQDQELQIEWDRWRNRFLRAVLAGAMDNLNNPQAADFRWDPVRQRLMTQFPLGTITWFSCQISNDRQIKNLRVDQSSGFVNYDQAVLDAVRGLEGTAILKFPSRSRRRIVSQAGGVKTSDQSQQQYFKFGDVERVRVPY